MPGAVTEASFKASVFVFEWLDVSVACYFMLIDLQRLSLLLEQFAVGVILGIKIVVDLVWYYYHVKTTTVALNVVPVQKQVPLASYSAAALEEPKRCLAMNLAHCLLSLSVLWPSMQNLLLDKSILKGSLEESCLSLELMPHYYSFELNWTATRLPGPNLTKSGCLSVMSISSLL